MRRICEIIKSIFKKLELYNKIRKVLLKYRRIFLKGDFRNKESNSKGLENKKLEKSIQNNNQASSLKSFPQNKDIEEFNIGEAEIPIEEDNDVPDLIENIRADKQAIVFNNNETMMQYFEWYYPCDGSLWNKVKENASNLGDIGITALWLPPACKAARGIYDVGYGLYDLFDLGEFNQKGTVRTRYGTKDEYLSAIEEAHKNNIKIYGDVVFNHKGGADEAEVVLARPVASYNRNEFVGDKREIKAHTVFNFPGRQNKYSDYKWTSADFDGVDFDDITKEHGIFKFEGKEWEKDVDLENGNYDFLMYADLDMDNPYVIKELKKWGKWYVEETNVDGFRLDAIKHIRFDFFEKWLEELRKDSNKELFAVGEYWTYDVSCLEYYMNKCNSSMSLFDVPLHFNFHNASKSFGFFDMRKLKDNTFLNVNPDKAVTFVDNHDTQLGQSLESWVEPWFKPIAYTFILTRKEGYPCVFYGDYYGIPEKNFQGIKDKLDIILKIRKDYAYGTQYDYIDNDSVIGWSREGDEGHKNSGLAAVITNRYGGIKTMYVGINHRGETWIDVTSQIKEQVVIDENGCGVFRVLDGSYSIWVNKNKQYDNR